MSHIVYFQLLSLYFYSRCNVNKTIDYLKLLLTQTKGIQIIKIFT